MSVMSRVMSHLQEEMDEMRVSAIGGGRDRERRTCTVLSGRMWKKHCGHTCPQAPRGRWGGPGLGRQFALLRLVGCLAGGWLGG